VGLPHLRLQKKENLTFGSATLGEVRHSKTSEYV